MIIDTGMTIAYKCSCCGSFDFFNMHLFKLIQRERLCLTCRCRKSGITITNCGELKLKIDIPCIACGHDHEFALSPKEILSKGIITYYCPYTGIQLCFIGNDIQVRERIDYLEREQDELIDNLGYDNYFKNTRVMFDSINRIHDIAEQGNLVCECGNDDIELVLLSDRIQLKCSRCPGSSIIHAASNEDLKDILKAQHIFLKELQNTI